MRILASLLLVAFVGCGKAAPVEAPGNEPVPEATSGPDANPPPDIGTRKTGSDWTQFLGPTGDSVSPEKGLVTPWPKTGPRIVWHMKLAEGYGAPAISRGRVFVFDRLRDRNRLRCCKSETGDELWRFEYPTDYVDMYNYSGGPRCCPVVDGDRVYIFGAEGMLHCLKAEDGKVVWKIDTTRTFNVRQNFFGVGSAPVIEGDLLITQIGGSPPGSEDVPFDELKGNGSAVVAFNKYTGKVAYQVHHELASYAVPVLTTIGDRRWCFVFARGGLLGMEPKTGKVDFHYPWRARDFESVNASNPVVVGDRVLITETYGPGSSLLQVKPGGYKVLWTDKDRGRDKSLMCHWNTPIHVDGYVYASSGRHTNEAELRCVELSTGKVMWSVPELTRCSLMQVDGHFVCLAEYGELLLIKINPQKFELVSRVTLKRPDFDPKVDTDDGELLHYPCWAAPVLSHGLLYVRGRDYLACLEVIPRK